jgi:glycosyl transferase family 1
MNTLESKEARLEMAVAADGAERLRVCVPTTRNFARNAFRCGMYEAEDVLADCADVDLLYLEPGKRFQLRSRLQWRLLYKDVSRRLAYANPGLQPVQLTKDYDLFTLVCPIYSDPLYVNAIRGWKERCGTSVCWIDELWGNRVPQYKYWLPLLREFDHVILGVRGSVEAVSNAIGHRCHYVPGGVDALRFSPYPDPPARVIDVYSIGRRSEQIHQSLLELASGKQIFYVHDTLQNVSNNQTLDYRAHRDLYANMAKRSRFFMVAPGLMNNAELTGGQVEVGFRYYEGSAAGAVLVGDAPDCETFRRAFDWPNAVIEIRPDSSDAAEVLAELAAQPERLQEISRRNAAEALLRHDWVYRWKEILAIAGLEPTPAMVARETRLKELAELARIEHLV